MDRQLARQILLPSRNQPPLRGHQRRLPRHFMEHRQAAPVYWSKANICEGKFLLLVNIKHARRSESANTFFGADTKLSTSIVVASFPNQVFQQDAFSVVTEMAGFFVFHGIVSSFDQNNLRNLKCDLRIHQTALIFRFSFLAHSSISFRVAAFGSHAYDSSVLRTFCACPLSVLDEPIHGGNKFLTLFLRAHANDIWQKQIIFHLTLIFAEVLGKFCFFICDRRFDQIRDVLHFLRRARQTARNVCAMRVVVMTLVARKVDAAAFPE